MIYSRPKLKERKGGKIGKGRKIDHVQVVEKRDGNGDIVTDSLGRVRYKTIFHYTERIR